MSSLFGLRSLREGANPWWTVALAALPLLLGAALFARHATDVVSYPHEVNQFEGHDFFFGTRAAAGESLYPDLEGYPYVANPYPPLHSLALGALVRLFGNDLMPGRLLSLVSILVIAWLVATVVRRRAGPLPALGAACLFLGSTSVVISGPLIKADPLGNALALAGLLWVTGDLGGKPREKLGFVFLALALLTKQTYLAAPAAACLALMLEDRRRGLRFGLALGLAMAAVVGLLSWLTDGQYLFHVLTVAGTPEITWRQLVQFPWKFFLAPALPLLVVAGALSLEPRRPDPLLIWAGAEVLLAVSAARAGAHYNYFIGPAAAIAIAFGIALGSRLVRQNQRLAGLMWILAALYSAHQVTTTRGHSEARSPWINKPLAEEVDRLVREEPRERPVLVEMAFHALGNDRPWLVHGQSALEARPFRQPDALLDDCRAGEFGLILSKRFLPELLGSCLRHNYEAVNRIREPYAWSLGNTWTVYRPRPPREGVIQQFTVTALRELDSRGPLPEGSDQGSLRAEAFSSGYVDLRQTVSTCQECSAFLTAEIHVTRPTSAILSLGADNGVAIAIDDQWVFESGLLAGAARPDSIRLPVELPAGKVRLGFRIDQLTDEWGFYARLADPATDRLPEGVRILAPRNDGERRQMEQSHEALFEALNKS